MQIRAHSPRTFSSPRNRNCRNPRSCLICPNTGSTINFRVAYTAAPAWVSSFRCICSTRLAPFDNGPGLQGLRLSLCFGFPVATNPSIFLFFKYCRFFSEQYPLSAITSCGFCPDCSSIFSTNGASCCLSFAACAGCAFLASFPSLLAARAPVLPARVGLPEYVRSAFPFVVTLPATRLPGDPYRNAYPLLCPQPLLGPSTFALPPATASPSRPSFVAHGLVLARIGLDLTPIQHHPPKLHRPRLQGQP